MGIREEFFFNLVIVFFSAIMFTLSCLLVDTALDVLSIKETTNKNRVILSALITLIFLIIAMIMTVLF